MSALWVGQRAVAWVGLHLGQPHRPSLCETGPWGAGLTFPGPVQTSQVFILLGSFLERISRLKFQIWVVLGGFQSPVKKQSMYGKSSRFHTPTFSKTSFSCGLCKRFCLNTSTPGEEKKKNIKDPIPRWNKHVFLLLVCLLYNFFGQFKSWWKMSCFVSS